MIGDLQRFIRKKFGPTREEKIMSSLDLNGRGIEIGPSHRPVAAKARGFNVEIIDHLSQDDLRKKYADHGVDLGAIEPVDHVWNGETYAELTGRRHAYRWIIASHVIEHTPDLIAFIRSCEEILDEDGVLALVVPDKRYCFDRFRQTSSLATIVDAHEARRTIHSVGTAADYFLNVVAKGGSIAWKAAHRGTFEHIHTLGNARDSMDAIRNRGTFIDLHAWCFTPAQFRLVMHDLYLLGYTGLREKTFFDTTDCEFFVSLSKNGRGPAKTRLELAKQTLS